jgi:hypothetical protein
MPFEKRMKFFDSGNDFALFSSTGVTHLVQQFVVWLDQLPVPKQVHQGIDIQTQAWLKYSHYERTNHIYC